MEQRLIIVDGYNLILRTPALKPGPDRTLEESREKLENLLSWAIGPEAHFLVVYDGAHDKTGGGDQNGRIQTRFSKPPQKADDLIRTLVEDLVERVDRLTVVSSDLEVARHARAMGADIALADLFLASALEPEKAGETPEKPTSLSKKELEEWAELFRRDRPAEDT